MTRAQKTFCKIVGAAWLTGLAVALATIFVIRPGPAKAAEVKLEPKPAPAQFAPFITDEQMADKNVAVTQCYMQQAVPLMEFDLKVVCLKKDVVLWIR